MPLDASADSPPVSVPTPEVRGLPLLGVAPWLLHDATGFVLRQARRHGTPVRLAMGPRGMVLVAHPDELRHVLVEHAKDYLRGNAADLIRPMLGNGLPLADGALWLRQRRTMQPAFHRTRLALMVPTMARIAARYAGRLMPGERLRARELMMRLTRDVIVETMFSDSLGADTAALDQALAAIEHYVGRYAFFPVAVPLWLPLPDNIAFRRAIATLDRLVYGLIAARRAAASTAPDDLLTALLAARDPETGEAMPDRQLRDEVLNIFFAGHETTANALTWATALLSAHPAVTARLRAEHAHELGTRSPTLEDVARLEYTSAVVREVLRLYPPAWIVARVAQRDDVLRGRAIRRGDLLLISPFVTHRLAEFWPEPERFDPERFRRDPTLGLGGSKNLAYVPFAAGPHVCIGNHFALTEAIIALVELLRRVELRVEQPARVRPALGGLLAVAGGLPVRVMPAPRG